MRVEAKSTPYCLMTACLAPRAQTANSGTDADRRARLPKFSEGFYGFQIVLDRNPIITAIIETQGLAILPPIRGATAIERGAARNYRDAR